MPSVLPLSSGRIRFHALAAALALTLLPGAALADVDAVATIKPIHSLLAAVMEGAGAPRLLIDGGSPHDYALKPSDARALADAAIVFRIGPQLEAFLDAPLASIAPDANVVDLIDLAGLTLHGPEAGEDAGHGQDEDHQAHANGDDAHDEHGHNDGGHDDEGHDDEGHDHGGTDPHIWLDPQNARIVAAAMASRLGQADPDHAAIYRANAAALNARISTLEADIGARLAPLADVPFVTFHDAYRGFTNRFGLAFAGTVTVDPSRQPGARHIRDMQALVRDSHVACVFSEPQFRPQIVETLVEDTDARTGVLDPVGSDIDAGPEQYTALMERLTASLADCLGGGSG